MPAPDYTQPTAPNGVPWPQVAAFERDMRQGYLLAALGTHLDRGDLAEARRYHKELAESIEWYGTRANAGRSGY